MIGARKTSALITPDSRTVAKVVGITTMEVKAHQIDDDVRASRYARQVFTLSLL